MSARISFRNRAGSGSTTRVFRAFRYTAEEIDAARRA